MVQVYFIDHFTNGFLVFLTNISDKAIGKSYDLCFFVLEKEWET